MNKLIDTNNNIENNKKSGNFFYNSSPKNIISGTCTGIGNITKGVVSGVLGLIACPIYYGKEEGVKGVAKGCGLGVLLAVVLPIGGSILGVAQIVRGLYNTPEAIYSKLNNKIWDEEQKKWILYSIEEEKEKIMSLDEEQFKSNISSPENSQIKELEYYNILNVSPEATQNDIKRSYYELAKETHPDRNESNGETFKQINEAYQVLGNEGLRKKYNKLGKEGLKDMSIIDSEAFYTLLFGTDKLQFYIGEIIIYTLMTTDNDNTYLSDLLKLKQKKREITVANNIITLLKYYVHNKTGDEDYYRTTKTNINNNAFSSMLLNIIGTTYIEIGESYLGFFSDITNSVKRNKRGITYKYRILSSFIKKETSKPGINIIINTVLIDVENTLQTACYKIFNDCTFSNDLKRDYAQGLIHIGTIFKENAQSMNDTRHFLELVF